MSIKYDLLKQQIKLVSRIGASIIDSDDYTDEERQQFAGVLEFLQYINFEGDCANLNSWESPNHAANELPDDTAKNPLTEMIVEIQNAKILLDEESKSKEDSIMQSRLDKLQPIKEILEGALVSMGYSVYIHTDQTHLPCPAIHIGHKDLSIILYSKIKEISIDSTGAFRLGGHNRKFDNVNELLEYIAKVVTSA